MSSVETLYQAFLEAQAFNQNLSAWDTSGVAGMYQGYVGHGIVGLFVVT